MVLLNRSRGVLALALPSSLPHIIRRNRALAPRTLVSSTGPLCLANDSSAPDPDIRSDPSFSSDDDDYEWLKRSRPMRIHARLLHPNRDGGNLIGSPKVTKIVHFQRHGQGTHNEAYR